jgi:tripartite-type tricarboxylate transporter receptor subunit TctC
MKLNHRTLFCTILATLALVLGPAAIAAPGAWSSEPVRIVVTFPPGGTSDLVARLLAQHLDTDYGQKAVVDNRPGAAGTVAADYVSRQAPDGTTLILSNNAPFTISPTRFKSIPYKPLAPMTYGSSGVGSISHILGEAVDAAVGVESIHVPYKGSSPAIQDFRAGVLDSFYDMVVQNSDMIEDKEAVAIAIASPERNPELPGVATFREQGYDVVIENWVGLSGPAGIKPDMAEKIHDTALAIFANPKVQARLVELGITHRAMSTEEYTSLVAELIDVWAPLIKSAGIAE